jgi:putative transposase
MYNDNIKHSRGHKNRPHHLYIEGAYYFITGRCLEGKKYFETINKKEMFVSVLKNLQKELDVKLYSWVLLDNHYHILCALGELTFTTPKKNNYNSQQKTLVRFVKRLHGVTSLFINKENNAPGHKIWYQYFDYCIRNKADFWKHFNYIIKNPFKHQLVSSLENAFSYKYSSNPTWLERFGVDGLNESFIKYPVEEVFVED